MKIVPIIKAESLIPKGIYCYTPVETPNEDNGYVFLVNTCPFWEHYNPAKHGKLPPEFDDPNSGGPGCYCSYLKLGDWMEDGTMLLWDQVKACGINDDFDPWDDLT